MYWCGLNQRGEALYIGICTTTHINNTTRGCCSCNASSEIVVITWTFILRWIHACMINKALFVMSGI